MFVVPVLVVVAVVGWSLVMVLKQRRALAELGPEQVFHEGWAPYFDDFEGDERIVELWPCELYQGALDGSGPTVGERAGRLAKTAAASLVGVGIEYFRPLVYVARTSAGRLVVSQEYAEDGERGLFQNVATYTSPEARTAQEAFGRKAEKAPAAHQSFVVLDEPGQPSLCLWSAVSLGMPDASKRSLLDLFPSERTQS